MSLYHPHEGFLTYAGRETVANGERCGEFLSDATRGFISLPLSEVIIITHA